jgi:hypothetical protein
VYQISLEEHKLGGSSPILKFSRKTLMGIYIKKNLEKEGQG